MGCQIRKLTSTQTFAEELANSISHGAASLAAASVIPILIINAVTKGTIANVIGATIFGVTMLLLYLASTIYHAPLMAKPNEFSRLLITALSFY